MEKCKKCGKLIKEPRDGVLGEEKEAQVDKEAMTIRWPIYCKRCAEEQKLAK